MNGVHVMIRRLFKLIVVESLFLQPKSNGAYPASSLRHFNLNNFEGLGCHLTSHFFGGVFSSAVRKRED
jgi:hypothetical protein